MKNYIAVLENKGFLDLNPITFGYDECEPNSTIENNKRYYLLQYIISGKGVLYLEGNKYRVSEKQLFIVPPNTYNKYVADGVEPWSCIWVSVGGKLAERFSTLPAVNDFQLNTFIDMLEVKEISTMQEEYLTEKLFSIYRSLFQEHTSVDYVNAVKNYIESSYMDSNLSLETVAISLNLDRSYLTRVFKARTGKTIQQYLIHTRISHAITLLKNGYSVTKTAQSVGYNDTFAFSKAFKKYVGQSPIKFKTKH